jgi:hypothetical protein
MPKPLRNSARSSGHPLPAAALVSIASTILPPNNVACGYTKLGELDLAFDLLERSLPDATPAMKKWMKHDSDLDGLRSHPRYQPLLDRLG